MPATDEKLRELTGYVLRRATIPVFAAANHVLLPFGLRRTTFSALTLITRHSGLRQGQLAELLAMEKPNVVQLIDDLEKAGFVKRQRAEDDRRALALCSTELGRKTCIAAFDAIKEFDAQLTRDFTIEELKLLHKALLRIEHNAIGKGMRDE